MSEGEWNNGRPRRLFIRRLIGWLVLVLVVIGLSYFVRRYLFQAFYVPSASMKPALLVGDRIIVEKTFFSRSSLHRGDIVVFHHPPADTSCGKPGEDLVKRVIATGGQTIWSLGNAIYIDGSPINESAYLRRGTVLGHPITRQKVPVGDVFLLGDNRAISCDSRYWGPIPTSLIIGKVVAVWWRSGHPWLHIF